MWEDLIITRRPFFLALAHWSPNPRSLSLPPSLALSLSRSLSLCSQKTPVCRMDGSPYLPSLPNLCHCTLISQAITALLIFHHCKFKVDPLYPSYLLSSPSPLSAGWLGDLPPLVPMVPRDSLLSPCNRMLMLPGARLSRLRPRSLKNDHSYKHIYEMACLTRQQPSYIWYRLDYTEKSIPTFTEAEWTSDWQPPLTLPDW